MHRIYKCAKGDFFMGKRVVSIIFNVIIMYLFSTIFLAGLTSIVFTQNLDKEVAEGGIMLTYILTGFVGGACSALLNKGNKNILWPALSSMVYCTIFLLISFGLGKQKLGENTSNYIMITLTVFIAAVTGYLLAYKKRK